ncbi:TMEM143 family protein [Pirellulaceae bacterium SH449]
MEPPRPRSLWKWWDKGPVVMPLERWDREHFIPLRPSQLLAHLKNHAPPGFDWETFDSNSKRIFEFIRTAYHQHRAYVTELYSAFDPDRDSDEKVWDNPDHRSETPQPFDHQACRDLFQQLADSLQHANYRRLSPREIRAASKLVSQWGVRLKIRFSSFRRLEVYGRGDVLTLRSLRSWKWWFRKKQIEVPIYQRLVVIFRTKELQHFNDPYDPDRVHIRIFKNVPKADIEMMFPGAQVRLTWLDTGKIGIPTLWGIVVMASKLAKSFWVVALLGAFKLVTWALFLIAFLIAFVFYGVRSILSYGSTKRKYQLNVARNLYFQNLDTNLGALLRIEDEGENQELCEALLAYYVLLLHAKSMDQDEVDRIAEAILSDIAGFAIDFDVDDALRDLIAVGLVRFDERGWGCAEAVILP